MDFKTTFISPALNGRQVGFALVEAWIAVGITSLLLVVVASFSDFSGRSFVALLNYVDLDDVNRIAMDRLTSDVRQASRVQTASSNVLVLIDADGASTITYSYSPSQRMLTRTRSGGATQTNLTQCDWLTFNIRQRNSIGGTYDLYPVATAGTAKVINVSWSCSRTIFGRKENTESVQTARIVIRKQGT